MKKFVLLALLILTIGAVYAYFTEVVEAPHDARHNVETYVRENISTLSPEPAVLGGTLYVTDIEATDGDGTVWYEDGHVAFVANFSYVEDKYGVTVTSFEVRSK